MTFTLDKFLVAFVIFSVFVVTGVFIMNDVNTSYDVGASTDDFNDTYNTIDEMYNLSQDMKETTIGGEISDDEPWESMTKGSFSAIRLVVNTFTLMSNIMENIVASLPIPSYFVKFALAALTIIIIFAVIYLFIGRTPR